MKKLLIASVLIAAGSSAFAADTGNYVFGNLGASGSQWTLSDGAANRAGVGSTKVNSDDASDSMVEIGVGQRINDNFAVEGSYLRHGGAIGLNGAGSLDYDSFRAAALGIIPVNDKFEVYGKVSANYLRSKFHSSNAALASSKDDTVGLGLGVGAAYKLNKQVSLRAEYETLGNIEHKDITDTAPVSVVKAGVSYQF